MPFTSEYDVRSSQSSAAVAERQQPGRPSFGGEVYHEQPSVLRVHDLEIDFRTRSVRRSGRIINLTPHEFALLQLLASRPGEIVTRAQIRDTLYKHHEHRSNVIDAHICYLRHKLDKGFDMPLILTRWGEGYLFRAEERPTREQGPTGDMYW